MTRHRWRSWALLVAALFIAIALFKLPPMLDQARAGVTFAARMGCACVFIEGRTTQSCTADFEPGMGLVSLAADMRARRVTAKVPLLAERSAHVGELGCMLD